MIYLDTNILIYAFCKNVDDKKQKELSQDILQKAIEDDLLVISEVVLYEFAFVCAKLQEDEKVINDNLIFLSKYSKQAYIKDTVINLMKRTHSYKNSFDTYHICFCDYFDCDELVTFDTGYKKFQRDCKTKIKIL